MHMIDEVRNSNAALDHDQLLMTSDDLHCPQ